MKSRPPRAIRVEALELEGRLLLAASSVPISPSLGFVGTPTPGTSQVTQVVTQDARTATVTVSDVGYLGALQVEVKTDPSSPAVGVNVGAVDQMVTFPENRHQATLSVPILAGAPNPGEVDVTLTVTPVNPPTPITGSGPLVLRILAPDASTPPTITADQGTPRGIVLTFSKPMDPAAASNVNNYAVRSKRTTGGYLGPDGVGWLLGIPAHYSTSTASVPLRAAEYDPATNSVTLIPKRRLTYAGQITVTQRAGSKKSSRPGHPSAAHVGLTDVEGNPINGDSTPGKFSVGIGLGVGNAQPVSATTTVFQRPSRV